MNEAWKARAGWLVNRNVLFVVIAVAVFLFWPESWMQQRRPLPRAETSTLVYQQEFDTDVLADERSGWSRLWTQDDQLVRVVDGALAIQFGTNMPLGAVFVLDEYQPQHLYEIHVKLRQVKTCGALIVRVRKKGKTSVQQIAGRRLLPTEGEGFAPVVMEFVTPRQTGREVLIQFYPYDAPRDRGGELILDRMEILQW